MPRARLEAFAGGPLRGLAAIQPPSHSAPLDIVEPNVLDAGEATQLTFPSTAA